MNKPAKGRIRNAFERAAKHYDQAADIQRRVSVEFGGTIADYLAAA